jgi:chromosomal replication initiation ATPase DnaA
MRTKINELDKSLEELIRRVGLNKSVKLLKELIGKADDSTIKISDERRREIISNYLKIETESLYKLSPEDFESNRPDAQKAKKIVFHLLRKNTNCSARRLGLLFKRSPRNLLYHINKCEEMLNTSGFHRDFQKQYEEIEQKLQAFILKID